LSQLLTRHFLPGPSERSPDYPNYVDFFRFISAHLAPESYFELGTSVGVSAAAFACDMVCVDPEFQIGVDVIGRRKQTHLYQMTSDEFFRRHDLRSIFPAGPDVCFLDGMHRAEYLLRDFLNTERVCHERSLLFMHDCLPASHRMAQRRHVEGDGSEGHWHNAWTGDVWKIVPALARFRPDLQLMILDAFPTGLLAVQGLKGSSAPQVDYFAAIDFMRNLNIADVGLFNSWEGVPVISVASLMSAPEDLTMFFTIR
jgi:hypothetical protein